jgi:hypothetical protein
MTEPEDAIPRPDWRAVALLVPVLAFQALRKVGAIYDSDTWWHLATGRLILEQKAIPRVDPFSWTANGEPWQPNGWLSDALMAALERIGGLPLVALLRPTFMIPIGTLWSSSYAAEVGRAHGRPLSQQPSPCSLPSLS